MTRIITSSTSATQATMDKVCYGSGYANEVMAILAYEVAYNGASWVVSGGHGSDQSRADLSLVWDGVGYKLDIDLSALDNQFTNTPVVVVSSTAASVHTGDAKYVVEAYASAVDNIVVRFWDPGQAQVGAGATVDYETTETTRMAFQMIIMGTID